MKTGLRKYGIHHIQLAILWTLVGPVVNFAFWMGKEYAENRARHLDKGWLSGITEYKTFEWWDLITPTVYGFIQYPIQIFIFNKLFS